MTSLALVSTRTASVIISLSAAETCRWFSVFLFLWIHSDGSLLLKNLSHSVEENVKQIKMHPSVYNARSRNKQKNVECNYRAISRRDEKPTQMNVNVQTSWASLGGSGSRWITCINKARAAYTAGWGLSSVRVLVIVLHVCRVCAASTVGPTVTVAQVKDTYCSPAVCWSAASLQTPDRTGWYWSFCPVFSQFNIQI